MRTLNNMKSWENIVKKIEKGESYEEATKSVPLAVKIKPKQFKKTFLSSNQQRAIRRG